MQSSASVYPGASPVGLDARFFPRTCKYGNRSEIPTDDHDHVRKHR